MLSSTPSNVKLQQVCVTTSARLHMGFFDLSHTVGHSFGGLGLAIDAPCTQILLVRSNQSNIDTNGSENVVKIVENFIKAFNLADKFTLKIQQSIPEHIGLGSGTQMVLAIGAGLNQLFQLNLSASQIAAAGMRGKRSAIGLTAFSQGGFLIDYGNTVDDSSEKNSEKTPNLKPNIDMHMDFPDAWRVLLVQDSAHVGVHGTAELDAFKTLKPTKFHLKSMLQLHMLPALQRLDLQAFGAYMQDLQAYNGDYFAPIQGGLYASKDVAAVLAWLQANGAACVGQSSWGPTGFAILRTQQHAESLQMMAQNAFANKPNISFNIVRGKNTGATISLE